MVLFIFTNISNRWPDSEKRELGLY